ncbi:hypothetical protein ABGB12_32260 [Actinocorallia sp. B10E7]|uniref:hypothetical protein n=1 Tax=Actinocorallia sp. B10E7 TaxID=3153558 RepID=UPI00325F3CF8
MDSYERLRRIHLEAKLALDRLAALTAPRDKASAEAVRVVLDLTTALAERAAAPPMVGLVGEMSAGKSRLLSTLLGVEGLLKQSAEPTTGNITAVHARPAATGERPGLKTASVSFLSPRELDASIETLLARLKHQLQEDNLSAVYPLPVPEGYNPRTDGWEVLEDAARKWWSPAANAGVRQAVWQLLQIRDALDAASGLLAADAPGPRHPLQLDQIEHAVVISDSRRPPEAFPERRIGPKITAASVLDEEALRTAFCLIHRITLTVAVDSEVWDLADAVGPQGVVFLDFPGLNAFGADRDEVLCRREIGSLTSFVQVIDSGKPETSIIAKFAGLLEGGRHSSTALAESVLIAANKFDLVEPVVPDGIAVTLGDLRRRSDSLNTLLRTLEQLGGGSFGRVVLTTADPDRPRAGWLSAEGALRSTDQPAARLLGDYMRDGGIQALRDRLAAHLRDEALEIELQVLAGMRAHLKREWARLRRTLFPQAAPAADDDQREDLTAIVQDLYRALDDLRAIHRALTDPDGLRMRSLDLVEPQVGLLERIRQHAVLHVYGWDLWRPLIDRISSGTINPATPQKNGFRSGFDDEENDDWGWNPREQIVFADTTDVFREPFALALGRLREKSAELVVEALEMVFEDHSRYREQAGRRLASPDGRALLAERLAVLENDDGAARLRVVERIPDPTWITTRLKKLLDAAFDAPFADPYPFTEDQVLPWHQDVGKPLDGALQGGESTLSDVELRDLRHHSALHRLRFGLAEALARPVVETVARCFTELNPWLEERIVFLRSAVPRVGSLSAGRPGGQGEDLLGDPFDPDE